MLNAIFKFLVYRFAGARILLAISVLGWLRNLVGKRRETPEELATRRSMSARRVGPVL